MDLKNNPNMKTTRIGVDIWWWYMAAVVVVYGYGSVVVYGHGLVVVYGYGFGAVVVDGRGDDDGAAAA